MNLTLLFAAICAFASGLLLGALIHRSGVRQGIRMARMAWNLKDGIDPLDEPAPMKPADPDDPPEDTI